MIWFSEIKMASLFEYDPYLKRLLQSSKGNNTGEGDDAISIISFSQIAEKIQKYFQDKDGLLFIMANQAQAYIDFSSGEVSVCPIQTIGQPPLMELKAGKEAQCCIKSGYVRNDEYFVTKVAAGGGQFGGNTGVILLFSQKTMRLSRILCDEGILTEVRTAAASCLASLLFMPKVVKKIGIVGGGVQAIWQTRFLKAVTGCRELLVLTRSKETAENFKKLLETEDNDVEETDKWKVTLAKTSADFRDCELIHTLTPSRSAIISIADIDLNDGREVHITAVGADSPGKQEIDPALLELANVKLCCDAGNQTVSRGEFQHLFAKSGMKESEFVSRFTPEIGNKLKKLLLEEMVTLDEILIDNNFGGIMKLAGRLRGNAALTVFDTSGVAAQDAKIAALIS